MEQWERAAKIVATSQALVPPRYLRRRRAPRTRQARWDAEHMQTASTRLTAAEMDRLKALCRRYHVTRHTLIRSMLLHWCRLLEKGESPHDRPGYHT